MWWQESALEVLSETSDIQIATTILRCIPFGDDSVPVARLSKYNELLLNKMSPDLKSLASVKAQKLVQSFRPSLTAPAFLEKWSIPAFSPKAMIARKLDQHYWSKMAEVPWQTWIQICANLDPTAGVFLWRNIRSTIENIKRSRAIVDWDQIALVGKAR